MDTTSLKVLWERCRWIGYINVIYFWIQVILYLLMIVVHGSNCKLCGAECYEMCDINDDFFSYETFILWKDDIIAFVITIISLYINYNGLFKYEEMPTDKKTLNVWLIYHKTVFFIIAVYYVLSKLYITQKYEYATNLTLIVIVLMVELKIVGKFNTEINAQV